MSEQQVIMPSRTPVTASGNGTIVYVGRFELPDRNAAAHRVTGNAKIFRDLGFRVILLGAGRDVPPGSDPVPAQCLADGIEAWQVAYPDKGDQWLEYLFSVRAFDRLRMVAGIGDLAMIICYNHPAIAQVRLFRCAKALGATAVADVTEWYSSQHLRGVKPAAKNADNFLRMHWANRRADGLIVASKFVTDYYRNMGVPMLNLPTIYPEQPIREIAARKSTTPPTLFFAGTGFTAAEVAKAKTGLKDRIDWLVELLADVKDHGAEFRQVVYGLSRDQFLAILPGHAATLDRLGDFIDFRGRVPHAELLDELRAADFSIFFRKETRTTLAGFPSKLAEAVTFGTPVITNPMPGATAVVEEGRTGFLIDIEDRPKAAARLKGILALPPAVIADMKRVCQSSGQFTYQNYLDPTRVWLNELAELSKTYQTPK